MSSAPIGKSAILGATKGMGRALAREMAAAGYELALLGRNLEELRSSATDLQLRGGSKATPPAIACDLADPSSFEPALAQAEAELGGLDHVIVTAGMFASQDELESDTDKALQLLTTNFSNTVAFCEHARKRMMQHGRGTLCVFSSVAGDRGRKPVVLYGASKAGLSAYLEGLDHKFRDQGLRTICVKPGFVKTSMTAGLKPPPFAGEAQQVAKQVLRAMRRGSPCVYTPGMWRWVMLVIRNLPRFIMRKIGF